MREVVGTDNPLTVTAKRARSRVSPPPTALFLLTAVSFVACFGFSCGPATSAETNQSEATNGTATWATQVVSCPELEYFAEVWGETVTVPGVMRVTVEQPRVDDEAAPVESSMPDNVVLYSMVTIENIGSDPLAYDQLDFILSAGDDSWDGGAKGLRASKEPALSSGTLAPGESARGAVPFQFSRAHLADISHLVFLYDSSTVRLEVEWR
jgi:hypothetical protein